MANKRRGGIIQVKIDGEQFLSKGSFTYDIGVPKKTAVTGSDSVHGYKEEPKPAMIEGLITDTAELDVEAFFRLVDVTVSLTLANGKLITIEEAHYAGDGQGTTEEGELQFKFEGTKGREVVAT